MDDLFDRAQADGGLELTVDLETQQILLPDGGEVAFEVPPSARRKLLEGLDDIGLTLAQADRIRAFETGYYQRRPWLRRGAGAPEEAAP